MNPKESNENFEIIKSSMPMLPYSRKYFKSSSVHGNPSPVHTYDYLHCIRTVFYKMETAQDAPTKMTTQ